MKVSFYDNANDNLLQFAVIISRSKGKWVFCKHNKRDTLEIPGGTREAGESIIETAHRELYEETGAVKYNIKPVCVYSVNDGNNETFGMLYYADITEFENELHNEIEKVFFLDDIPDNLTYPHIQPYLMKELKKRIDKGEFK